MKKEIAGKQSVFKYLKVVFTGFAMGVANVIPGVSGGTMIFILGLFEEIVEAVGKFASLDTLKMLAKFEFKKMYNTLPWRFLLALGIGIFISFALVANFMADMLRDYPNYTFAFFFGLIAGSIFIVGKMVKKWNIGAIITLLISAIFAYWIITLPMVEDPSSAWYITLLCGVIAICAMILPGISGSFLLLILGQYQLVWRSVGQITTGNISWDNIKTILLLGAGCVLGLALFVHIMKFFFRKWYNGTVAALIGFMIGSIPRLWPWQQATKTVEVRGEETVVAFEYLSPASFGFGAKFWLIVALVVAGLAVVIAIELMAAKKNSKPGQVNA